MKNKMIKEFRSRTLWIIIACAFAASVFYGAVKAPFYLHFIDGLSILSFFYILIGIVRWAWAAGDLVFFSWKPIHGSYSQWRKGRREERKDASNPFLYAGILLLIVSILLTVLY